MTPENFAYWLHGFFEIGNTETLTKKQIQTIKEHLDLLFDNVPKKNGFKKVTPVEPHIPLGPIPRGRGGSNVLMC